MASAPEPTNIAEWTVSELAGALRRTLEDRFGHVRLRGEIFGYRGPHSSGHAYFCLKDRDARIDAVVWKTSFSRLRFKPQEGLEVIATGRVTTFPGKSTYQIVVESLEPAGAGALMALLDERRRRLAAEGLFAAERKRPIPFLPRAIGVVTSPTGAVIRDILHRLEDRFPRPVLVWPVRVQGDTCGAEVAAAIAGFDALPAGGPVPRPDVVIVARGGGSLEDLWGFNDEAVVRAAIASRIPIVSAVGHETDWTLLDHAADLRAPTPTGAAEMVVPVRTELLAKLGRLGTGQRDAALRLLETRRLALRSAARALPGPDALFAPARQRLDLAAARLGPGLLRNARLHETELRGWTDRLRQHSPRTALAGARGRIARQDGGAAAIGRLVAARRKEVTDLAGRLEGARLRALDAERQRIAACHVRLGDLLRRGQRRLDALIELDRGRLQAASGLLASLGYRSVLERGYALVRDAEGRPVTRAAGIGAGQALVVQFADGPTPVTADGGARAEPARVRRTPPGVVQGSLFDM